MFFGVEGLDEFREHRLGAVRQGAWCLVFKHGGLVDFVAAGLADGKPGKLRNFMSGERRPPCFLESGVKAAGADHCRLKRHQRRKAREDRAVALRRAALEIVDLDRPVSHQVETVGAATQGKDAIGERYR